MKKSQEYINNTDLEFDTEINREYYEGEISKAINEARMDIIDDIIEMYVPDGNPEFWLNKISKLRGKII